MILRRCITQSKGVVEILRILFSDENGRLQAVCTDKNRGWIITVDKDNKQVMHKMKTLKQLASRSDTLKDKIREYSRFMSDDIEKSLQTQQLFKDDFNDSYELFSVLCFNHYITLKNHAEQQIKDGVKIENGMLLQDEDREVNLREIGESAANELYLPQIGINGRQHRSQRIDTYDSEEEY